MKVPVDLQVVLLTVGLTGFYMMVGQAVPQKEVQAPEVIEIAEDISDDQMVEIGQGIFEGKGLCSTCHTIGKSGALRFPDLDNIAVAAASRKPGMSATDYLAESLYEPNAFIVPGFSAGMAIINKPPISLTDPEILTVMAYLQTLGGEPTVTMETKFVYTGGGEAEETADMDPFEALGCASCHYPGSTTGKPLLAPQDRNAVVLGIDTHPPTEDGSVEALTVTQLRDLVASLSETSG